MKKRVVLDTNIFISILKRGKLRRILDCWLDGKFDLVISNEIIEEMFRVLVRPKFKFTAKEIEDLGSLIFERAIICNPTQKITICQDKDDNKFIECALKGEAQYIVSGDFDLLILKKFKNIEIISPAEFLKRQI